MASWVLNCTNCGSSFTHSPIEDTLENFFFARKPAIPEEGQSLECPNCHKTEQYLGSQLKYQG